MGLFSWISGADRLEDARRVLLEDADEKISAGVDEFAVEIRGGDFGTKWANNVDSQLVGYVTRGLSERGLVILGVDQATEDSLWVRVKNPAGTVGGQPVATPRQETFLEMKDGRRFPLEMSVDRAEQILADAAAAREEFVTFPAQNGMANVQFVSEVDGIGIGGLMRITPSASN